MSARAALMATFLVAGCSLGDIGGSEADPSVGGPSAPAGAAGDASTNANTTGNGNGNGNANATDGAAVDGSLALADGSAPQDGPKSPLPGVRDLTTDRSQFFGATRCAQSKVALCEDFENGTIDAKTWQIVGTPPVIDGVQKARGNKALHITQNGNGVSFLRETKTFPTINNDYFGRAFYWFSKMPSGPDMTFSHWTILAGSGTQVSGEIRVGGFLTGGKLLFGVGTDSGNTVDGTGDWTTIDADPGGTPAAIPLDQWVCVEWQHKGSTNETRFFWDAVEHPSLHTTPSINGGNGKPYILPTFNEVWIGWAEYQASSQTFELWVDEIAIDAERIGCVL